MMKQLVSGVLAVVLSTGLGLVGLGVSEAPVSAQSLGDVSFPTSAASKDAQAHFQRGVKLLHSFTFESAEQAFQDARAAEPDFVMAYWGEALSHNHPLLPERDPDLPRQALSRLAPTRGERLSKAPTERERGFLNAVEELFGEGSEMERSIAYSTQMEKLAARYPDDKEVQAFYAVSMLGTVRFHKDRDFRVRMKAGAIASQLFADNPGHPGAAHYVIHSFDDPVHAPLALTAAKRYAEIAPDAAHALHMPSHIFIQHGMWDRVSRSNDASYDSAHRLWLSRDELSDTEKFYNDVYIWHALDWGQYGDLQRGDYKKAHRRIELLEPVAEKSKAGMATSGIGTMTARYIVETEKWKVLPVVEHGTPSELFVSGMSAVRLNELGEAKKYQEKLEAITKEKVAADGAERHRPLSIMAYELKALVLLAEGTTASAMKLMDEAVEMAQSMRAPNGTATPVKPPYELYGEMLLSIDMPDEAKMKFEKSLLRMPNRTLSLRGLARAATKTGDADVAKASYDKLIEILGTHSDNESYREAKAFVSDAAGQ